jgi:hypothetical protein
MECRKDNSGTELADFTPMRDRSVTEEKLTHLSRPYNLHSLRRKQHKFIYILVVPLHAFCMYRPFLRPSSSR